MFHPEEPRDTKGRWIRLGRGDLEKVLHAAVDARAHDIARTNGHDEAKAKQIQAHLRRQVLRKIPAAPVYNVRISEHPQYRGGHSMHVDVHAPGSESHRHIRIPNSKRAGNLEQRAARGAPGTNQIDRPDVHGEIQGTATIADRMKAAAGGTVTRGGIGYAGKHKFEAGAKAAAHEVAKAKRENAGKGAETLPAEAQARQMEALAAEGRVGAAAGKAAAELIRKHGGSEAARKHAKGAAKKALAEANKPPPGQGSVEQALAGPLEGLKNMGRMRGVNGDKYKARIAGQKVFIKIDALGYSHFLRDGIGPGRPDGPPERGAYLVGNVMGVNGGVNGKMPAVVLRDIPGQGHGMVKQWVEGKPMAGSPRMQYKRDNLWYAFDAAIGNLDRHGGNHILAPNGIDYYPVDQGLAFPDDASHMGIDRALERAWGLHLQPNEKAALQKLVDNKDQLTNQLEQSGLKPREISSMWGRVHGMLAAGRFPNSAHELALWGKPGRVEGDPAKAAKLDAVPLPAGHDVRVRNALRDQMKQAGGKEPKARLEQLQQIAEVARQRQIDAINAGDHIQQQRWKVFQPKIEAKINEVGHLVHKNEPLPAGEGYSARLIVKQRLKEAKANNDPVALTVLARHARQKMYNAAGRVDRARWREIYNEAQSARGRKAAAAA